MPLHLRDMWISTDDYKDVLFTCPVWYEISERELNHVVWGQY